MWLWVGVTCGRGKELHTHENKHKPVTFRLLPPHDFAMDGKTRGWKEIREALHEGIHKKKTELVFDKWQGILAACKQAGYAFAPPVNHSLCFRDHNSGFHSNDLESENNKIKQ